MVSGYDFPWVFSKTMGFHRRFEITEATRQPGNFNDPKVLWVHLHSYGGTTICDLARAHGEKVSPPKDNCTEVEVVGNELFGAVWLVIFEI
jgi:hypothetical protein